MSTDFAIDRDQAERLINLYKLDVEQKNLIFQEFNKFKPQTSVRQFIKEVSKRIELPEDLLQNFFWFSYDFYILLFESGEPFDEFFENNIKSPMVNEFPEVGKKINDFEELKKFFSRMFTMVNFEYYKIFNLEGINQINVGFSNICLLYTSPSPRD